MGLVGKEGEADGMADSPLTVVRDGHLWHVSIQSPDTRNALSTPVLTGLAEALRNADTSDAGA